MNLKGLNVLVTGGAGFIGSNLVDELIRSGNKVTVVDDLSTGKESNLAIAQASGKLNFVKASILDTETLRPLVKEADVVFHMAVVCLRVSFANPHIVHEVNATGSLNLLQLAREGWEGSSKPHRFVYVSSSEVYGTAIEAPMSEKHPLIPTTTYGASKLAGELYTHAFYLSHGLPAMVVRPFNTYGYREHYEGASGEVIPRFLVRALNDLPPVIFGDGEQTRDFTFIDDTVRGIIAAASCDAFIGDSVNVACGREVTVNRVAELLLANLGRSDLKVEYREERPADVRRHFADIAKLQKHTDFKPSVAFEEGLPKYIEWFRKEHTDPRQLLSEVELVNWEKTDARLRATAAR
jgi:UDP-glucose 4-epimerase